MYAFVLLFLFFLVQDVRCDPIHKSRACRPRKSPVASTSYGDDLYHVHPSTDLRSWDGPRPSLHTPPPQDTLAHSTSRTWTSRVQSNSFVANGVDASFSSQNVQWQNMSATTLCPSSLFTTSSRSAVVDMTATVASSASMTLMPTVEVSSPSSFSLSSPSSSLSSSSSSPFTPSVAVTSSSSSQSSSSIAATNSPSSSSAYTSELSLSSSFSSSSTPSLSLPGTSFSTTFVSTSSDLASLTSSSSSGLSSSTDSSFSETTISTTTSQVSSSSSASEFSSSESSTSSTSTLSVTTTSSYSASSSASACYASTTCPAVQNSVLSPTTTVPVTLPFTITGATPTAIPIIVDDLKVGSTYAFSFDIQATRLSNIGTYLCNFTTLVDGVELDISNGQYYMSYMYTVLNRAQSNYPGWRSHGTTFEATSTNPNITIVGLAAGSQQPYNIGNITLVELCASDQLWPPTTTCIHNASSPDRVFNGNFKYYDARYPSQLSYWGVRLPGPADNILALPGGGNTAIDASNSVGILMSGLAPSMSQTLYNLDTSKPHKFSYAYALVQGLGSCNMTAWLDGEVFYSATRLPYSTSFVTDSAVVTPKSETATLAFGIVCGSVTGALWGQNQKFTLQYLAIDDVSFVEMS